MQVKCRPVGRVASAADRAPGTPQTEEVGRGSVRYCSQAIVMPFEAAPTKRRRTAGVIDDVRAVTKSAWWSGFGLPASQERKTSLTAR